MIRSFMALLGTLCLVVATTAGADDPPARRYDAISLSHCGVEFDRSALLGSPIPGVLQDCLVQPGDVVKARQVLGHLQDGDARAEAELKTAAAKNDSEVRLKKSKLAVAQRRLSTSTDLYQRKHLSGEELLLQRLEAETAVLEVEEAEQNYTLAQIQKRHADAMVHAREFVAPYDGVVLRVFKAEGESINLNDPVFRIVNTERVRVSGQLDVVDAWRVKPGQPVRIILEVPGAELDVEREVFTGQVVFVDSQIEAESQTCTVVARADNRGNLLKGGLSARMEILPNTTPASGTAPAAAVSIPVRPAPPAKPDTARRDGAAAVSGGDR